MVLPFGRRRRSKTTPRNYATVFPCLFSTTISRLLIIVIPVPSRNSPQTAISTLEIVRVSLKFQLGFYPNKLTIAAEANVRDLHRGIVATLSILLGLTWKSLARQELTCLSLPISSSLVSLPCRRFNVNVKFYNILIEVLFPRARKCRERSELNYSVNDRNSIRATISVRILSVYLRCLY